MQNAEDFQEPQSVSSPETAQPSAQTSTEATSTSEEQAATSDAVSLENIEAQPASLDSAIPPPDEAPAAEAQAPVDPSSQTPTTATAAEQTSQPQSTGSAHSVGLSMPEWWAGLDIEAKQYGELHDDGTLVLKANGAMPERTIATLTPEGRDATLRALTDKHAEVKGRVETLRNEWDAAEDKGRLGGRVESLREYLLRAPSLGNYAELYDMLQPMEDELSRHAQASYAARLALVEEAEQLAESTDWKATTTALRDMTDRWKASPPLDKSRADELWGRLEKARDKFFERKRLASEEHDKELMNNLSMKLELVDKAEALAASDDWRKTTEALKGLMDEWKSIGRAAGGRDEELWARFSAAKTVFFDRKKAHFDTIQKEQEENLAKKMELLEKAEAMQHSTDWNKTSAEFEELLKEWRNVGKVPIEKADEIRARMEAAKDTFFGARRSHFETVKVSLTDNYAQKLALLKRAESIKNSTQWRETTVEFTELMDEWKKIGPVPREHSRRIWNEFLAARNYFFDRKDADRERRNERHQQHAVARVESQRQFLRKLEEELAEEKDNLADFRVSIGNITPGPKAKELHEHLTKLIAQTEERIARKEAKVAQVRREVDALKEPKPEERRGREQGRGREGARREEERGADAGAGVAAGATAQSTGGDVPATGGGESGVSEPSEETTTPAPAESPDKIVETTDAPPASTEVPNMPSEAPASPAQTAQEQNNSGAQDASPDATPASEASMMQTGEDPGNVDEASAPVD